MAGSCQIPPAAFQACLDLKSIPPLLADSLASLASSYRMQSAARTAAAAADQARSNHEERLKDNLRGSISTYIKVPELAQRDITRELSAISKTTVSKEKAISNIDQALYQLPRSLGSLDELLSSINHKAGACITKSIARLRTANAAASVGGTALSPVGTSTHLEASAPPWVQTVPQRPALQPDINLPQAVPQPSSQIEAQNSSSHPSAQSYSSQPLTPPSPSQPGAGTSSSQALTPPSPAQPAAGPSSSQPQGIVGGTLPAACPPPVSPASLPLQVASVPLKVPTTDINQEAAKTLQKVLSSHPLS